MDPRRIVQAFDNPNFRDSDPFAVFVDTYKREALRWGISPKQDKVLVLLLALFERK